MLPFAGRVKYRVNLLRSRPHPENDGGVHAGRTTVPVSMPPHKKGTAVIRKQMEERSPGPVMSRCRLIDTPTIPGDAAYPSKNRFMRP